MDMFAWMERGWSLSGTNVQGTYIAERGGKYRVLVTNFWGEMHRRGEDYSTEAEARSALLYTPDYANA